jgi:hypothetical protein
MKIDNKAAEEQLKGLSPEDLRPILSRLSAKTPGVLYYGLPFKARLIGLPIKTTNNGEEMNPLVQSMMFCAVAASDLLEVGDTLDSEISSIQHGNNNSGSFKITVTRVSK